MIKPGRAVAIAALLLAGALVLASGQPLEPEGDTRRACEAGPHQPDEEDPEAPWTSPCKNCTDDRSKCAECWPTWSPNAAGECVKCEQAGRCLKCKGDKPGFCLECGDWWGENERGFYADSQGKCQECPQDHCLQCESITGTCTRCTTGMGVIDGQCQPCADEENCAKCNGKADVCEECMSGHFLKDGKCIPCPEGCYVCANGPSTCTECSGNGNVLDPATSLCVPCTDGCTYCPQGPNKCENCDTGYTNMTGGSCGKCTDPHCTTCTPDNPTKCTICADSSLLWGVDLPTGTCVRCKVENCEACQMDATKCDWCKDGFFNDEKQRLCTPCKGEHCTSCGRNETPGHDPTVEECFGCEEGYDLDESIPPKCVPSKT